MIELRGKYNTAKVYNDNIEEKAIGQIINFLNHIAFKNGNIAIMSDVHFGKGAVIGFTAPLSDYVIPNVIGVDLSCGVTTWLLGKRHELKLRFDELDRFIRNNIPSSCNVRANVHEKLDVLFKAIATREIDRFSKFEDAVKEICDRQNQNFNRVMNSIGSLGGGNHFLELGEDSKNNLWFTIHSGSRNFGLKIAEWHQNIAADSILGIDKAEFKSKSEEIKATKKGKGIDAAIKKLHKQLSKHGKITGLEYLEDKNAENYIVDTKIAHLYAKLSRRVMGYEVISSFYKLNFNEIKMIESTHNYIDTDDNIIRKGAIRAHKGEKVIISMSMQFGNVIATGIGNKDWNYSAAHGAGRKMSRQKAKADITLEKFQYDMKGIWSSCVSKATLDEAPRAYKNPEEIIEYMKETIDIDTIIKPLYNFKATEDKKPDWNKMKRNQGKGRGNEKVKKSKFLNSLLD